MAAASNGSSSRTAEAARIVADQLGCSEEEALARLRERAFSLQYRVHDYARLVTDGMVRFDSPTG
jgi:hypothetical protein